METYQAQVNVTNTKFQPLGDPQEHEIFTSYGQTLTFTEIVVEDGEFITDLLAGMKSGEMPSWNFQGVIKGRNGSEERLVYNDCVPSGNIDLQNVRFTGISGAERKREQNINEFYVENTFSYYGKEIEKLYNCGLEEIETIRLENFLILVIKLS